jgi:hypothetical protein
VAWDCFINGRRSIRYQILSLAAGLGAGLATYAQTGGSGSKALLSGLTAGFGTNALKLQHPIAGIATKQHRTASAH